MRELKIYNTLKAEKEVFKPITEGFIGMYVCGPTVYDNVHLGNVRTFISFDMIYRYLLHLGYKVRYVRNITDAGHLTDDNAEDKITTKARLEQLEPMEIVQKYTVDFHEVLKQYNLLPPSIEPTATGHIVEQIEAIQTILESGMAYVVNGSVYFDVLKYNETENYGILSKRVIEDGIENTRELDGQSDKKNPQDFALWKKAEENHIQRWNSPWSVGFPGWHLECTVMSTKYLGSQFDIHGGGMDLKFPHHECEIAQAQVCNHKAPVNYWMHTNMLNLNGKKMSKSTGNSILPSEIYTGTNPLLSKAYSPIVSRFFMMQAHYSSILDLSDSALLSAEKGFLKLMNAMETLDDISASDTSTYDVNALQEKCYTAMNDDFNTPILIAHLFDGVRIINSVKDGKESLNASDLEQLKTIFNTFVTDILGFLSHKESSGNDLTNEVMELVLQLRGNAKKSKDFDTADLIRDELNKVGIQIKDGREGSSWEVK